MREPSIEADEAYQVAYTDWCERNDFDENDPAVEAAFASLMDEAW